MGIYSIKEKKYGNNKILKNNELKTMNDRSNKKLLFIFIFALGIITLIGAIISISKLSSLGQISSSNSPTGFVTDSSAYTNVTIAGTAGLTISSGISDFGSGYYNASCTVGYTQLWSDGGGPSGGSAPVSTSLCWINTSSHMKPSGNNGQNSGNYHGHTLTNSGSTTLNLTMNATVAPNAEYFICGSTNGCPSSTATVYARQTYKEINSCTSGGSVQTYTKFLSFDGSSQSQPLNLCDVFEYADNTDELYVDFNLTIPSDVPQGARSLSVTYIATSS